MNKLIKTMGVFSALLASGSALAEEERPTYWLDFNESSGGTYDAWTNPQKWKDSNGETPSSVFEPTCDYVVSVQPTSQKTAYLRWTNNNKYLNFAGNSLTVENGGMLRMSPCSSSETKPLTFGPGGLVVDKGTVYPFANGGIFHIGGLITVASGGMTIQGSCDSGRVTPIALFLQYVCR